MDKPLSDWIGNTETAHDVVTAAKAAGMAALLDWDEPAPGPGAPLPAMWHWMFFSTTTRQSQLGVDGHPARGGFMPPVPLPRRMFAGSKATYHAPLRVGDAISRTATILSVEEKDGRSGPLVFVRVLFAISGPDGLAIEDEHTIVYREEPSGAPPVPPKADLSGAAWTRTITPEPVMLFRYSALTFIGHRIHYDRPYATGVEFYPGLVVHGPLIANLMSEQVRIESGGRPIASYSFRAISPLYDVAPFTIAGIPDEDGGGCALVAVNADGGLAMQAHAVFGG